MKKTVSFTVETEAYFHGEKLPNIESAISDGLEKHKDEIGQSHDYQIVVCIVWDEVEW